MGPNSRVEQGVIRYLYKHGARGVSPQHALYDDFSSIRPTGEDIHDAISRLCNDGCIQTTLRANRYSYVYAPSRFSVFCLPKKLSEEQLRNEGPHYFALGWNY